MVLFGWQRFTPWQTSEKTEDLVVHRFKTLELCNAAWGISKMNSDKAENGMQARIHAVSLGSGTVPVFHLHGQLHGLPHLEAIASAVVAKVKDMNPQESSDRANDCFLTSDLHTSRHR